MQPFKYFNWGQPHTSIGENGEPFCPHLQAVTVIENNKVTQIGPGDCINQSRLGRDIGARGATVCLTFYTEQGERFYRVFQFHKGDVFEQQTECEPIPGWNPEDDPEPELWRD